MAPEDSVAPTVYFQITQLRDCALYNPRPMTESGIALMGSVMRGGYEEKPVKGGEWHRKRGAVMPGMTESVWHNTASMTMCVQSVMETTRGPRAQQEGCSKERHVQISCVIIKVLVCSIALKNEHCRHTAYQNISDFTFITITISIYIVYV